MIGNDWDEILCEEFQKNYFKKLTADLDSEYQNNTVYPARENIFNALKTTNYRDVKVVILGQDPYHGRGQAHGLAFSVCEGVKLPPSLKNIFKEIHKDKIPVNGDLTRWAKQGVLLLNTVLTVREAQPESHKKLGWGTFTDTVISKTNEKNTPVVYLLWGAFAISKQSLISNPSHLVLTAPHPSPLSAHRGFFGCNHFNLANDFLKKHSIAEINWYTA